MKISTLFFVALVVICINASLGVIVRRSSSVIKVKEEPSPTPMPDKKKAKLLQRVLESLYLPDDKFDTRYRKDTRKDKIQENYHDHEHFHYHYRVGSRDKNDFDE